MSRDPRVTVGLPVYNGAHYLRQAVDSILAQDFGDFELLIADNGSTDETHDIAQRYADADARVRVHRSESNKGAAWNYNRVVDLARGDYFKWAAHDDVLVPSFLSRCVEVLDGDEGVSLVYTRAVDIDESGALTKSYELQPYAMQGAASARAASVLFNPSPCFESFGVIRREQLLRTNRIGAYTSSDRTLFLELSLMGRFVEVPSVLFLHRQHPRRSVHLFADARSRNIWFDPSWEGKRSAPRWRLLKEYASAVRRADLPLPEKARTGLVLARWVVQNKAGLARDAVALSRGARARPIEVNEQRPASSSGVQA